MSNTSDGRQGHQAKGKCLRHNMEMCTRSRAVRSCRISMSGTRENEQGFLRRSHKNVTGRGRTISKSGIAKIIFPSMVALLWTMPITGGIAKHEQEQDEGPKKFEAGSAACLSEVAGARARSMSAASV